MAFDGGNTALGTGVGVPSIKEPSSFDPSSSLGFFASETKSSAVGLPVDDGRPVE